MEYRFATLSRWFNDRNNQLLLVLILFAVFLHLWVVPFQDAPIGDEAYYVTEARAIIDGSELTLMEHPSLGKLFIAAGISVLGDNPWGWRMPSIIFAVASVVLFYFVCRKLAGEFAALLASFLLMVESLVFNYSGAAMLDVFSLTFMLLAFLFYLHNRYVFSGVSLALSGLCKMTGLLGILVILVHWFVVRRRKGARDIDALLGFTVVAFVTFVMLMPIFDFAATREWLNPIDRIWLMTLEHQTVTFGSAVVGAEHLTPTYPWQWLFTPCYAVEPEHRFFVGISPTVWIMIVPSIGYALYEFRKRKDEASLFIVLWFAAIYLPWVLVVAATGRVTYVYYLYPAVGAICLAIALAMWRLWQSSLEGQLAPRRRLVKRIVVGYLAVHALWFLVFTPVLFALNSYLSPPPA